MTFAALCGDAESPLEPRVVPRACRQPGGADERLRCSVRVLPAAIRWGFMQGPSGAATGAPSQGG
jgi:hypothetical protein